MKGTNILKNEFDIYITVYSIILKSLYITKYIIK